MVKAKHRCTRLTSGAVRRRNRPIRASYPYDLELAVMSVVSARTGHVWSLSEIGEMCGITRQAARMIEVNAMKKVREAMQAEIQETFPFA